MFRKHANPVVWLVIALLVVSLSPGRALGASPDKISLEKAIQIAKRNFVIPDGYTQFDSSFSSNEERQVWYLSWSPAEDENGNLKVRLDAVTGEILSLNLWKDEPLSQSKIPSLSLAEAKQKGQELLQRLHPDKLANLVMDESSLYAPISNYGPTTCNLNWKRMYKNIPVSGNGVNMSINLNSGQVTSFYLNWNKYNFPDPGKVVSQQQAAKIFADTPMLQLQYIFPGNDRPYPQGQEKPQPQLVYTVRHQSNGVIDAFSGTPLIVSNPRWLYDEMGSSKQMSVGGLGGAPEASPLTPEELKEVESSSRLITKEQAIQAVQKWVSIPADLVLESSNLTRDWRNPELRNWELNWRAKDYNKLPFPGSLSASVNAFTGELISFYLGQPELDQKLPVLNQKASRELAEKFLKEIQPQRFQQVKYNEIASWTEADMEKKPAAREFSYIRLVNGVLCPDNGMEVRVDAVRQKITSYRLNWTEVNFPSTQGVLGQQACEYYFKAAPLTLTYLPMDNLSGQQEKTGDIKLVYQPERKNDMYMIDARSGAALDWQGKPVTQRVQAVSFNDIKGHFAEREISILGQAGLMREYGKSFHPNEDIKAISLLKAMLGTKEGVFSIEQMTDQQVIKRCQQLGWVKGGIQPASTVNREMLANLMIRYLGFDSLTRNDSIFCVPYQDADSMNPSLKASSSIAWGLGIIKADGKIFKASHVISRGEAASALVHTLQVGNNSKN